MKVVRRTCNPDRINRELMEQIDLSAAQIKSRDQEIERLKGELREATESLEATMAEEQVPSLYYLHLFIPT